MDRETFAARFREAAAHCRSFAMEFLEEELPADIRFRLRLNSSHDGNPLQADEVVFPEDSAPERARQVRACSADDVIATLWRADRVPEWADLSVIGVTPAVTLVQVLACGRFTANEELLYHQREGRPPFHVVGPSLPVRWVEGQRFSIYYRSTCASPDELEAMRPHAAKAWSLDLEGPMATDEALLALPDLPNLEILEILDSGLRGPGLSALNRFPKLRIVRIRGVADDFDASEGPKLKRLEEITVTGLPPQPCGIEAWAGRISSLDRLSLGASGDLHLAGPLPKRLGHLTLTGSTIAGTTHFPKRTEWLSLNLAQQDVDALDAYLAPVRHVDSLWLRGTPAGDALVEKLLARWRLTYVDLVDTAVSPAFLRRLALDRPDLKMHPRPDLSDITSEQVARRVAVALSQPPRFTNFHGVEPRTLRAALVAPHPVMVVPWRNESPPRQMWAVLRETAGRLVVFDPRDGLWAVAMRRPEGWVATRLADSLDGALSTR